MEIISRLEEMRDIAKNYAFLENIFKYPYKEKRIRGRDSYLYNTKCNFIIMSNIMSYLIGYSYERCKDYSSDIIDKVLNKYSFWKNIECSTELTPIQKFRQFRNCFGHADFFIGFDDTVKLDENGNYYIENLNQIKYYFGNDKINGEISFSEFAKLYNDCINLFTKYNGKNKIAMYMLDDRHKNPNLVRNENDLNHILDNMTVIDVSASYNPLSLKTNVILDNSFFGKSNTSVKNVEWDRKKTYDDISLSILNDFKIRNFINNKEDLDLNQINMESRKLTKIEKKKIKQHIKYITNNYKTTYRISDDFFNQVFNDDKICYKARDVILSIFLEFISQNDFKSYSLKDFQKRFNQVQLNDDLIALSPGLYMTTIISSANYFLNYIYEINKQSDNTLFQYKGINIDDIDIVNNTDEDMVKTVDPLASKKRKLIHLSGELKSIIRQIDRAKNKIEIFENPQNKDPHKKEKLIRLDEKLKNYNLKIKNIQEEINDITSYIDLHKDSTPYTDVHNLFRVLRNSVSHGRFSIDFDSGYKTNNMEDAIITFYDVEDENEDIKNASTIVKMTLGRFEKLVKNLSEVFLNQLQNLNAEELLNEITPEDNSRGL